MKGEKHVFYTLLSAGVLLSPVVSIENIPFIVIFLIAAFVGSLAPDADSADSSIMHGIPGGNGTVRVVRRHNVLVLPFFGYLIRYLIYFPLSALLWIITLGKVKPKHRGLLHSLFGTFFMSAILTAMLLFILYLLSASDYSQYALLFGAGMFFGAFMHLVEDSCSKSGVYWFFPFSDKKIGGTLLSRGKRNLLITAVLGIGFAAVYVRDFTETFPPQMPFAAPLIVLFFAWAIILKMTGAKWS
ncbi:metal-dependent hydrolase [Methanolacinia petrolearia]|uniref:metal-dependent hydrolase n=1 Tax=Methanolacinia petrolearia TaxID=54120 RepID=UPI003BAC064F